MIHRARVSEVVGDGEWIAVCWIDILSPSFLSTDVRRSMIVSLPGGGRCRVNLNGFFYQDEEILDRMVSPIPEGSYRTPVRTDEGGEEVIRETSEETAVNSTSSSPELEYEEENQVVIPIPPPSLSPVRGQRSTRARCRRPVGWMHATDFNVIFGSDLHAESAVVSRRDDVAVSTRSRGVGSGGVRRRERLDCPYALVGPACRGRLDIGDEPERQDGRVDSGAESDSGSSLS
jgi:hypothetical protein